MNANVPPLPRKSWFSRNWFWFIPLGCLGMIVAVVGSIAALVLVLFGAIRQSDAYKHALDTARSSPELIEAIGEPIEPGMMVMGSINVTPTSGEADIAIPVTGPKGAATIYIVGEKTAGTWEYFLLEAEVVGRTDRINLLPKSGEPPNESETAPAPEDEEAI